MKRILVLLLTIIMTTFLCACEKENTQQVKNTETIEEYSTKQDKQEAQSDLEYIEKGATYVALGDGKKALLCYTAALNLQESAQAYLGLVDSYILLHEFEAAQDAAALGSDKTGDERLQSKCVELKQGKAGKIFSDVAENNHDYVVLKNNQPTAVLVSIKEYKEIQEKISRMERLLEYVENIRLLNLAEKRENSQVTSFESLVKEDGFSMEEIEKLAESVEFD